MKPVKGFSMHVAQGKELPLPVRIYGGKSVEPEAFYVVSIAPIGSHVHGGPYPTEERAFGDVSAITDTSGT